VGGLRGGAVSPVAAAAAGRNRQSAVPTVPLPVPLRTRRFLQPRRVLCGSAARTQGAEKHGFISWEMAGLTGSSCAAWDGSNSRQIIGDLRPFIGSVHSEGSSILREVDSCEGVNANAAV
jgi:hypothetical protein